MWTGLLIMSFSLTALAADFPSRRLIKHTHCAMDLLAAATMDRGYDLRALKEHVVQLGFKYCSSHDGTYLYLRKYFSARLGRSIDIDVDTTTTLHDFLTALGIQVDRTLAGGDVKEVQDLSFLIVVHSSDANSISSDILEWIKRVAAQSAIRTLIYVRSEEL
jgi:hypothetical protein